jgi:predicted sugar kinase
LAFERLPPVPTKTTERLCDELHGSLMPAAAAADFSQFGESLYRFGRLAGSCFAAQQGGEFAGPRVTRLVGLLRSLGVRGVGQTSWGPTVFALMPDDCQTRELVAEVADRTEGQKMDVTIAAPCNHGARMERAD